MFYLLQGIALPVIVGIYVAFPSLYATLVCVACSQMEKCTLALLDIRQTHVVTEQQSGDEIQHSDVHEQHNLSDESFRHMQEQLNNCIRHHQLTKRCCYKKKNWIKTGVNILIVASKHFLLFQIHGSARKYNESPSVWCTVHVFDINVLYRLLYRHGKVLSWSINISRKISEIKIYFWNIEGRLLFVTWYVFPKKFKIL